MSQLPGLNALPILYSFRRCPYAMRARMALFASAQPYLLREVVLRHKPSHMLDISPKGTVPVLQLPDGRVIDESLDVMAWALAHKDPENWLKPSTDLSTLIETCDTIFKTHLDRYKYASRYDDSEPITHRNAGEKFIAKLEDRLDLGPFLGGDQRALADIAIAPFVRQFALADWDWFFQTPYPKVQAWLNTFIDTEPFTAVMNKFEPWAPGDADTLITSNPT